MSAENKNVDKSKLQGRAWGEGREVRVYRVP